ncbi:MAG: hypothetical protein ACRBBP_05940 [Bdellovibrionales bacterium]
MSAEGQSKKEVEEILSRKKKQSGQMVLEYILLMLLAVSMASIMKSSLIGGDASDPSNAGVLTKLVYGLANTIAADTPGE